MFCMFNILKVDLSPQFTMFNELYVSYPCHVHLQGCEITLSLRVGWKWVFSMMPYGEAWRERRRAFAQYFHSENADLYKATQAEFLWKMLPQLLKDPEDFLSITRQYVS